MSSDKPEFKITPTLTVAALGTHYVNEVLPPASTPRQQRKRNWKVRTVCRKYREHLQREPLVRDLEREAVVAFLETIKDKPCYKHFRDTLRTLRKQAILGGALEGNPGHKLLSENDGRNWDLRGRPPRSKQAAAAEELVDNSLWWWCVKRYFPSNLAIRSDHTKLQYRLAINNFQKFLGRVATPADLTEDNVVGMMKTMLEDENRFGDHLSPRTINERRSRLRALWEWLARRKVTEFFPTIGMLPVPKRAPRAWSREQLDKLFAACRTQRGAIEGIPARLWWDSLHLVGWDSGERIGALLQARLEDLDLEKGILSISAEARKGGVEPATYELHPDTVAVLAQMMEPKRELIWPWPLCPGSFHLHYKKLLGRAGLAYERGIGFHQMRRSVASHLHAAGYNATDALGHSTPHVTKKSYLDPKIARTQGPSSQLFRPAETPKDHASPPVVQPPAANIDDDWQAWL